MTVLGMMMGRQAAAGGGPKTYAFLQAASSISDLTTYTFASQNIGTASADRHIIACIYARKGAAIAVSTVTIGGVSATEVIQQQSSPADGVVGIYVANVPTGTTGDVVVTFSTSAVRAAISLYQATGITTTAHDSDSSAASPPSATINVVAGGFAIGAAQQATTSGGAVDEAAWTNLTEDYDAEVEQRQTTTSASDSTPSTTTLTPSVTFTNESLPAGVFTSW